MCIYWTHEWLIFWSDCTLHFVVIRFFKEALKFIDIFSLIPRTRSPFVAVLQASLVGTWEWDYKFMYTCQPVWAKARVGLINLQLSHKDVLAKGQIYTQLVTCPDPFRKGVCTVHKTNSASAQNSLQLPKWNGWGWGVHVPLPTWRGTAGMHPAIGAVTAVHRVNQFTVSIPAAWTTSTTPCESMQIP